MCALFRSTLIVSVLVFIPISAARSQNISAQLIQTCERVYFGSIADIKSSKFESFQYRELHRKICNGKTVKSDFNINVTSESIINNFTRKFGLGGTNSRQKQEIFCENVDDKVASIQNIDLFERRSNNESETNLNACLKMALRDASITHTIDYPDKLHIKVSQGRNNFPTTIKGISLSGNITCTSPAISSLFGKELAEDKEYSFEGDFAIICTRHRDKSSNEEYYGRASVTFSSDTFDNYTVTMLEDRRLSPILAREAHDKIADLSDRLDQTSEELSKVRQDLATAEAKNKRFSAYTVVLLRGAGGSFIIPWAPDLQNKAKRIGCVVGAAFDGEVAAACQPGYEPTGSHFAYDSPGGPCGRQIIPITCIRK